MDKLSYITMLMDFYGNLLTEKQRMIMSYHYEEDMSLSEISEVMNISRQAVHDIIKRSEKTLLDYEKELGLVEKFLRQKQKLIVIKNLLLEKKDKSLQPIVEMIEELIDS
ncbi:MAG: putative DNA-binding protein [Caloramator sp.]|nr:putative DNA-binding protein [Caloramator sp.]